MATTKKTSKEKNSFMWTDDEVELLLHIILNYKTTKAQESIDWESVYTKYADITDEFHAQYPNREEAEQVGKDFPHVEESINKGTLTTKVKNIKANFRKAVDSGRKSGHGRVVMLYFELCEQIWGGSPATASLPGGIESTDLEETDASSTTTSSTQEPEDNDGNDHGEESTAGPSTSIVKERRHLLQVNCIYLYQNPG